MKLRFVIILVCTFCLNLASVHGDESASLRQAADRMKYENALQFYELKKYSKALQGFQEYLEVWQTGNYREEAYDHMADIYIRDFNYENAVKMYDNIFREFRNDERGIKAYYKKGLCCLKMGYNLRAMAIFKEILSISPGSRSAVNAEIQLELMKISGE